MAGRNSPANHTIVQVPPANNDSPQQRRHEFLVRMLCEAVRSAHWQQSVAQLKAEHTEGKHYTEEFTRAWEDPRVKAARQECKTAAANSAKATARATTALLKDLIILKKWRSEVEQTEWEQARDARRAADPSSSGDESDGDSDAIGAISQADFDAAVAAKAQAEKDKAQAEKDKAQAEKDKAQAEKDKAQAEEDAKKAKRNLQLEKKMRRRAEEKLEAAQTLALTSRANLGSDQFGAHVQRKSRRVEKRGMTYEQAAHDTTEAQGKLDDAQARAERIHEELRRASAELDSAKQMQAVLCPDAQGDVRRLQHVGERHRGLNC